MLALIIGRHWRNFPLRTKKTKLSLKNLARRSQGVVNYRNMSKYFPFTIKIFSKLSSDCLQLEEWGWGRPYLSWSLLSNFRSVAPTTSRDEGSSDSTMWGSEDHCVFPGQHSGLYLNFSRLELRVPAPSIPLNCLKKLVWRDAGLNQLINLSGFLTTKQNLSQD